MTKDQVSLLRMLDDCHTRGAASMSCDRHRAAAHDLEKLWTSRMARRDLGVDVLSHYRERTSLFGCTRFRHSKSMNQKIIC